LLDDYDKTVQELRSYRQAGGCSLVDAQPVGCGRIAQWLERASRDSGVAVIAVTGFHRPFMYPADHWIHTASAEKLSALFVRELLEGMFLDGDDAWPERTGSARAGVIKAAAGPEGISGRWETLFEAAAEASSRTGAPILCHTEGGKGGLEILRFFTDRGIAPDRLILCHLDRIPDNAGPMAEVAAAGAWLELDTIGRFKYHSDESEMDMIRYLHDHGLGGRILLGLDTTRTRMRSYGGGIGLDYIHASFFPLLRQNGFQEPQLRLMIAGNPAKALARKYEGAQE
jgi:phosphotriesterase-related protein